jgi:N6-adenosine-specific RNA methylase IME4
MPEDENGKLIHSAKPPEIYEFIERLWPGPYVETFARNNRDGWTTLGDQVPEVIRGRA